MSLEVLLSRLERVRKLGPDRWTACCPAHDDKHPSLSIRETQDGTILVRCFPGCAVVDIVAAVGMELSDLFPAHLVAHRRGPLNRPLHRPAFRTEVFDTLRHEAGVVWIIGCDMHAKREISESDYDRLQQSIATLERIAEAAYGC